MAEFGNIRILHYLPGEKDRWLAFEKNTKDLLDLLRQKHVGRWKAIAADMMAHLYDLVEDRPNQKEKIEFHANKAALEWLETKTGEMVL